MVETELLSFSWMSHTSCNYDKLLSLCCIPRLICQFTSFSDRLHMCFNKFYFPLQVNKDAQNTHRTVIDLPARPGRRTINIPVVKGLYFLHRLRPTRRSESQLEIDIKRLKEWKVYSLFNWWQTWKHHNKYSLLIWHQSLFSEYLFWKCKFL